AAGQGVLPLPDREAAFRVFTAKGLPSRRNEAWHYTDLRQRLTRIAPLAATPREATIVKARSALAGLPAAALRLVILDGRFIEALSSSPPKGVGVASLGEGARAGRVAALHLGANVDAMLALNGALAQGGCVIKVDPGVKLAAPIEIRHWRSRGEATSCVSRLAIELGDGAEARIVEYFEGVDAEAQRNHATAVDLGVEARCEHVAIVEGEGGLHVESLIARLALRSSFSSFGLVAGGDLVRRQIFASLAGEGAKLALSGLSLIEGRRHADTTLTVNHVGRGGESREFYKHIVADEGTGVYQGKVIVEPGAQKTDGGMKSQAILLSPTAAMNNKPELEIFADDVICGHGATVGALDRDQLFYLRARGLPEKEAEAMLLEAFGFEAIERVGEEALRELLREKTRAWLSLRANGAGR
ncbi:MAG TPA: SufD family Fe-S cluster assembly protein, partial [Roseiarcus sp.]|nr:SufD family Fe-S cluster assembly protein [Roseiarcus sp.]